MLAEKLLGRLEKVKATGTDKWLACCPAHPDKNPSLGISEVSGKLLIKCWAGCYAHDVIDAAGLSWSDLFADDLPERQMRPRSELDATVDAYCRTFKSATTDEAVRLFCKAERATAKKEGRKPNLSTADLERERQAFQRIRRSAA